MAAKPYSTLKGDPYRAYEELPAEVRRALQEALVDWCPLRTREWLQGLLRQHKLRPPQAAAFMVQTIRGYDQAEVTAFAKAWPAGAQAYPHLAAGATLQRYTGAAGMPVTKLPRLAPQGLAPRGPAPQEKKPAKKSRPMPKRRKGRRR